AIVLYGPGSSRQSRRSGPLPQHLGSERGAGGAQGWRASCSVRLALLGCQAHSLEAGISHHLEDRREVLVRQEPISVDDDRAARRLVVARLERCRQALSGNLGLIDEDVAVA